MTDRIETNGATTTFAYWAKTGNDRYGEPLVAAASDVTARIERSNNRIDDPKGKTVDTDATLYGLSQDVIAGSIVWQGASADYATATDLFEITSFSKVPDIKGNNFRREATIRRFKDKLPLINS